MNSATVQYADKLTIFTGGHYGQMLDVEFLRFLKGYRQRHLRSHCGNDRLHYVDRNQPVIAVFVTPYLLSAVTPGQLSVRNPLAGSFSLL